MSCSVELNVEWPMWRGIAAKPAFLIVGYLSRLKCVLVCVKAIINLFSILFHLITLSKSQAVPTSKLKLPCLKYLSLTNSWDEENCIFLSGLAWLPGTFWITANTHLLRSFPASTHYSIKAGLLWLLSVDSIWLCEPYLWWLPELVWVVVSRLDVEVRLMYQHEGLVFWKVEVNCSDS